jgi:hypothetical protein
MIGTPGIFLNRKKKEILATTFNFSELGPNIPYPPLQIPIICRHNIDPMLNHPIYQTIIRIGSSVITLQPLESLVFRNPQRKSVFGSHLLQLGKNAV